MLNESLGGGQGFYTGVERHPTIPSSHSQSSSFGAHNPPNELLYLVPGQTQKEGLCRRSSPLKAVCRPLLDGPMCLDLVLHSPSWTKKCAYEGLGAQNLTGAGLGANDKEDSEPRFNLRTLQGSQEASAGSNNNQRTSPFG